jgi:hypothetical protein
MPRATSSRAIIAADRTLRLLRPRAFSGTAIHAPKASFQTRR